MQKSNPALTEHADARPVVEQTPGSGLPRLVVALVLIVAFGLRLYVVLQFSAEPFSDAGEYHRLAIEVSEGNGYVKPRGTPTAFRPPAYPAFVGGVYALAGPVPQAAYIAQAVLNTLTILFLILFVNDLLGPRPAAMVGVLAAIYPGLIWLSRLLLSENLTLFLLAATLWVALKAARTRRFGWAVLLGILLGLAMLTRTSTLLVTVLVVIWMVFHARKNKELSVARKVWPAVVAFLCAFLVIVPWQVRNAGLFDRFFFISTQDGHTLYASYWPPSSGSGVVWGDVPRASEDSAVARAEAAGDEAETAAILRAVTFQRLAEDPSRFFELIPTKLFWLSVPLDWEILPRDAGDDSYRVNVGYLLALPFAAGGAWLLLRRRIRSALLLLVVPVSVIIQTIFFYGGPRLRMPAELSLLVLAGVGLEATRQALVVRNRTRTSGIRQPA